VGKKKILACFLLGKVLMPKARSLDISVPIKYSSKIHSQSAGKSEPLSMDKRFLFPVILFLIILSGCATNSVKKASGETGLRERVMAYWNYKINEEFDKSYGYEEPSYRKNVNLTSYIGSIHSAALKWKSVEIKAIKKQAETADVDMKVRVQLILPQFESRREVQMDAQLTDRWVKVDGAWYHRSSKRGLR
jgi:hypothetical protein